MKVIMIEPGLNAQIVELDKGLKNMQNAVGGSIEAIYPFDDNVALVCNEDGKFNGSVPNRALWYRDLHPELYNPNKGEIFDIIYGSFFICGAPTDSDEFQSLSEQQIATYYKLFEKPDFPYIDNQKKTIEESEKIKKYELNCDYSENTNFAIDIANHIVEYLNNGEYDDLDTAIMQELDSKLIYYADQWELMKNYQTPQEANYNEAIEMLITELYSIITEKEIEEELEEQGEER